MMSSIIVLDVYLPVRVAVATGLLKLLLSRFTKLITANYSFMFYGSQITGKKVANIERNNFQLKPGCYRLSLLKKCKTQCYKVAITCYVDCIIKMVWCTNSNTGVRCHLKTVLFVSVLAAHIIDLREAHL
jgi:hypothetical protein